MGKDAPIIDTKKRTFLKALAIGGGVLAIGKIFGPSVEDVIFGPTITKDFDQFSVSENKRELKVFSKDGEEIFIMDNER